jgi:hypothetical protein
LVSVKLIMMAAKNVLLAKHLDDRAALLRRETSIVLPMVICVGA